MSLHVSLLLILVNLNVYRNVLLKGRRVQDGQFPWLIQFQTVSPCGGVLLSPDWVLTAAQCVQDKRNSIILFATGLNGTDSRQTIPVKATYIYPTYDAYSTLHDRDRNVALLKLSKPFDLCHDGSKLPVVMPVEADVNYKLCLIFGWQSYVSPSSKVLAKPMQFYEVILSSWKMYEMKACAGNPGTPIVCENQNKEMAVVGIASWTKYSLECENLLTYLDLATYRIWMNDLVYDNRQKERMRQEQRSSQRNCKFGNEVVARNKSRAAFDLLQSGSYISYSPENTEIRLDNLSKEEARKSVDLSERLTREPYFWEKTYHTTLHNVTNTEASTSNDNDLNYKEIGWIQDGKSTSIPKSSNDLTLCNKTAKKLPAREDPSEMQDFEILLPFILEDASSCSTVTVSTYEESCLLFYVVFCYSYASIYT